MFVPPCQIIDTVEIYHKDHTRYISLRFLANYVLKRDMQQDVHDSVEDATAAFELYQRAEKLIAEGAFDKFLNGLYAFGQQHDWRLGAFD
jgi:PAB-dependent poly(A)-specific ribonuclease subunit 2